MLLLTDNDINEEFAERLLDKIHLSMTKANPTWQEWAMSEDAEAWQEGELNRLSRQGLHAVLEASEKDLSGEAKVALAKALRKLGAEFLADYLKVWAALDIANTEEIESNDVAVTKSEPTEAQKRAGNYKKDHIRLHGLDIAIENRKGSYRSGVDPSGREWKNQIKFDYGYIKRTQGADGDHVDVFVGPDRESEIVYVINQNDSSGDFDEHKVMLGFHDSKAAKQGYLANYAKAWKGFGSMISLTIEQFKDWLNIGSQRKPLHDPQIDFIKAALARIHNSDSASQFRAVHESASIWQKTMGRDDDSSIRIHKGLLVDSSKKSMVFAHLTDQEILSTLRESISWPADAILIDVHKGGSRSALPIGSTRPWKNGSVRIKDGRGRWVALKEEQAKPENLQTSSVDAPTHVLGSTVPGDARHRPLPPSQLPFNQIRTISQYTAKEDYDRKQIANLKQSILNRGYDSAFPMIVDWKDNAWTIVAGHHRYEAIAELVKEGQLPAYFDVAVVPKDFTSNNHRLVAQLSENHRRNPLPTNEAEAYGKMVEEGWDPKRIAKEMGLSVGDINRRLALNNLHPDLFKLVHRKDRSLPLGVAEAIGMSAIDVNGKPNTTMQIRAFKWFVENRSKYPGRGPAVVQNYIKDLRSGELDSFDFDNVATDVQREALRTIGSMDRAVANRKMLGVMLDKVRKSYQPVLGDNISALSPQTIKELAASLSVAGDRGIEGTSFLGQLGAVIQDLSIIKNSLLRKMQEIETDAAMPLMFAKALSDVDVTLHCIAEVATDLHIEIFKASVEQND